MSQLKSLPVDRFNGPKAPEAIPLYHPAVPSTDATAIQPFGARRHIVLASVLVGIVLVLCMGIVIAIGTTIAPTRHQSVGRQLNKNDAAHSGNTKTNQGEGVGASASAFNVPSAPARLLAGAAGKTAAARSVQSDVYLAALGSRESDPERTDQLEGVPRAADEPAAVPESTPVQSKTVTHATAQAGDPFGVGRIEILFGDEQRPTIYPDQSLFVEDLKENRLRFPVFRIDASGTQADARHVARRLVVYFLFLGDAPLRLRVATASVPLSDELTIEPLSQAGGQDELLVQWWRAYAERVAQLDGPAAAVQQLMQRALARRLGLNEPPYPAGSLKQQPLAALERQFERSISTLLGIDSLLLAVPEPSQQRELSSQQLTKYPLPAPLAAQRVRLPSTFRSVPIEPIALHVPQDCFYLRCRSLENYTWLRRFVRGWGGSLNEIVSVPTLRQPVRERVESQLAISLEESQTLGMEQAIDDMALIGCDFFFDDGAAVGVLLQAADQNKLSDILEQQRRSALGEVSGAQVETERIDGHNVSFLHTADHRLRSFYAREGKFHLITNCRQIMRRFLAIRTGQRSVGALQEFRYAKSKTVVDRSQRAYIYLSDPFFRQLASPHYRTEVTRRARAVADMQELAVARLVAASETTRVSDVQKLMSLHYLPAGFDRRADGSGAQWSNGRVVDSLRGCRGTFLPIPDVEIQGLTMREVTAYQTFGQQYRRQWGRVDPLSVTISSGKAFQNGMERVDLDIHVTPYARQRYAFLARHLAPASRKHVSALSTDVLSVNASLRDPRGQTLWVQMGLQDRSVGHRIREGKLEITEPMSAGSFAYSSQYLAVTPPGVEKLQLVRQFVLDMQGTGSSSQSVTPLESFVRSLFGSRTSQLLVSMFVASMVETRGEWTLFARDDQIRDAVSGQLQLTATDDEPAQVRMSVTDPQQANVTEYLEAFAFAESRRASSMNAQMLNDLTQQLGVPAQESVHLVETVFAATPVCPLGGRYELTGIDDYQMWRSTAWRTGSLYEVNRVPDDYQFTFLHWLRGADVHFVLSQDTLHARVQLKVAADPKQESIATGDRPAGISGDERLSARVREREELPIQVGDRVAAAADRSPLRVGAETVMWLRRDMPLTVVAIQGRWVGVEARSQGRTVRGWIPRERLGPPPPGGSKAR